jgi:endonuclease/exonuclease/phosphatase family metal-dependent hydrolase
VLEAGDGGADATDTLKIATFNIQVFGRTKAAKSAIMAQLVAIIRKYDVVAVQEIKDTTGAAPKVLLNAVNSGGDRTYAMLLSPRTGIQPDDKTSQEQYAVFYDTTLVEALPGDRLFDDERHDLFQREPYVTPLRVRDGGFSFVLIGIHTRPESAVEEIGGLHDVVEWARTVFPDEDDFIALGDFNAGCDYASPTQLDALDLRGPGYVWIVPDDSDSNVSPTTACAYDRIVTTVGTKAAFTGNWGVHQAFTDKAVSDHWPVWAEFSAEE